MLEGERGGLRCGCAGLRYAFAKCMSCFTLVLVMLRSEVFFEGEALGRSILR
jgi:hypothetical protein